MPTSTVLVAGNEILPKSALSKALCLLFSNGQKRAELEFSSIIILRQRDLAGYTFFSNEINSSRWKIFYYKFSAITIYNIYINYIYQSLHFSAYDFKRRGLLEELRWHFCVL